MFKGIIINKDLENEVLGSIPKDYSTNEQAAYIYTKLCRMLRYSVDYYIGKKEAIDYFTNPENIEKVDGKTNKDIVCYTFNAILLELLRKKGLVEDLTFKGYDITYDDKLEDKHSSIIANIAGFYNVRIDGTAIDGPNQYDTDINRLKYSNKNQDGWCGDKMSQPIINAAFDKVLKDYKVEPTEAEKFINILAARYDGKQKDYPLEERVDMFIKSLSIAEYSMFGFHNLKTMSLILFTKDELTYNSNRSLQDNIYYKTVVAKDSQEVKVILGHQKHDKIKEKNELYFYEISLVNFDCKRLSPEEYKNRLDTGYYVKKQNDEKDLQYPKILENYLKNYNLNL